MHEMSKSILWEEIENNIILSAADFAHRLLKVI